jgi:hypothetical protein
MSLRCSVGKHGLCQVDPAGMAARNGLVCIAGGVTNAVASGFGRSPIVSRFAASIQLAAPYWVMSG